MRTLAFACLLLAAGLAASPASAAQADDGNTAHTRESMVLKVANRGIIVLHGPVAGHRAAERVERAGQRIREVLKQDDMPEVTIEETPVGSRVLLGGAPAFLVTRLDVDEQIGETTAIAAEEAAARLRAALVERREQSSARYLAIATGLALAATLAASLLAWMVLRLHGRASRVIAEKAQAHSEALKLGGIPVFSASHILTLVRPLFGFLILIAFVLLAWAWLSFVLTRFPYTRPWGEQLGGDLLALASNAGRATFDALPGLLVVALVVYIARTLNRGASLFFDRVESGRVQARWLDADTARPTRRIVTVVIWLFALALAYPYLPGAHSDAFKGLSVLVGLMVSLGAASVVGQAFSGLILMYSSAIRAGEYVRIGNIEGTVTEVGMFVTRIRTGIGQEVTVPNSSVMSGAAINYSRTTRNSGYIVDTSVTIGYSTPWRQVHAMLIEAARRTEIATEPAPEVRQTALSDFYVEYRLIGHGPGERPRLRADLLSELHANIQDVFNEHGVQIMSPNYEADPPEPQVVPKERWYEAPAKPPESR